MATVAYIDAHLDLNTGQFTGAINSAGASLRGFSTNVNRAGGHVHKFHGNLMSTVVVLGQLRAAMHTVWALTGQWAMAIIDANAKLERLQVLMKGLSRSSTEAGKVTDALRDMNYVLDKAKSAPFSIDEIGNAFVKLKSSGIDPTKGSLDALMNAVASFGGDDQTFHRATVAIQQMAGKGVISMEELRQQLGEAVPNAMNLLARATNMSMSELVKTISSGRLEAKSALDKLFREMDYEFRGGAKNLMTTWVGMMAQLKTEWLTFAKVIGDQGVFNMAKASVADLMRFMKSEEGRKFAYDTGRALKEVLQAVTELVSFMVKHRETIVSWGKVLATVFIASKIAAFTVAIIETAAAVGTFAVGLSTFATRLTAAGAAVGGFGAQVSMLAGPVGIAIAILATLAIKVWDVDRAARTATASWVAYMQATKDGIAVSPEEYAAMRERKKLIDEINAEVANKGKTMEKPHAIVNNLRVNDLLRRARAAGGLMDEKDTSWVDSLMGGSGEMTDKLEKLRQIGQKGGEAFRMNFNQGLLQDKSKTDGIVGSFASKLDESIDKVRPNIVEGLRKINAEFIAGTISKDKAERDSNALRLKDADAQLAAAERARTSIKQSMDESINDQAKYQAKRKLLAVADAKIVSLQEAKISIASPNKLMDKPGGGDGAKKAKADADALSNLYDTLKGKIAGMNAELADGNVKLSTFEQLIAKTDKYGKNPNKAQVSAIRQMYIDLKDLAKEVKDKKTLETVDNQLEDMQAAASADTVTNALRLQTSEWGNAARGVISFNREIAVMRLKVIEAKGNLEEFDATAAKIADTLRMVDLQNFGQQTKDDKWSLYLDKLPEKARAQAIFNRQLEQYAAIRASLLKSDGSNAAEVDAAIEARKKLDMEKFQWENRSALQQWIDQWGDTTDEMNQLWGNSMDSIAQSLTDMITTGKMGFKDLARSILSEITKILVSRAVAKLAELVLGLFGGFGGGGGTTGVSSSSLSSFNSAMGIHPLAKGGVMTGAGLMPLKMYSSGGVANSPQMTIFGEGRTPEAFVPLPDGKNIPVKMAGGGGMQSNVDITVVMQSDGTSRTDTKGDTNNARELGKQLESKVKDVLVQEMRPGGIIWKMRN